MRYEKENNLLLNSFLNRTFFKAWKESDNKKLANFQGLELFVNAKCNLKCKYCYIANYGKELYPPEYQDEKKILKNTEIFLKWLVKKNLAPRSIEVFSGEPFVQEIGFKIFEIIFNVFKKAKKKPAEIIVPTNYTFILSEKLTKRVENLLFQSRKLKIPVFLSASIDGKYCETNRPFLGQSGPDPRDDEYYDKVFKFNKKWDFAFHPMIYSEEIEKWKDNFLWFQRMFKRFGIPFDRIYLLEVRNKEWTREKILKFAEFIEFLIKFTFFEILEGDAKKFLTFLVNSGFNILRAPLIKIGKGLGCSIQNTLHVRLGDLAIVPCHRTSYAPFIAGKFLVRNDEIIGIKALNPELFIAIISMTAKNQPQCESCLIKEICSWGCLGSQFETTGDLFSPIPTVCLLQHAKIAAMAKTYEELGILNQILSTFDRDVQFVFTQLIDFLKGLKSK